MSKNQKNIKTFYVNNFYDMAFLFPYFSYYMNHLYHIHPARKIFTEEMEHFKYSRDVAEYSQCHMTCKSNALRLHLKVNLWVFRQNF